MSCCCCVCVDSWSVCVCVCVDSRSLHVSASVLAGTARVLHKEDEQGNGSGTVVKELSVQCSSMYRS